jgi:hypothetical protein
MFMLMINKPHVRKAEIADIEIAGPGADESSSLRIIRCVLMHARPDQWWAISIDFRRFHRRQVCWIGVHHHLPRLDDDRIGFHAGARIDQAAAGGDFELPHMPGTTNDLALSHEIEIGVRDSRRATCNDERPDPSGAERSGLVRAEIAQRVERAIHIEHADAGASSKWHDDFALAGGKLFDRSNDDAARVIDHANRRS